MTDERTKVFLLLDEAEKRQKTAEQQQAALKDLLQASQTTGNTLDKGITQISAKLHAKAYDVVPKVDKYLFSGGVKKGNSRM